MSISTILDTIKKELLSWPYVTAESHRFGGLEFRLNKREMGHLHGDRVADIPFSMDIRKMLVNSARVSAHHFLPHQDGLAIGQKENKIFLMLLSYLR